MSVIDENASVLTQKSSVVLQSWNDFTKFPFIDMGLHYFNGATRYNSSAIKMLHPLIRTVITDVEKKPVSFLLESEGG